MPVTPVRERTLVGSHGLARRFWSGRALLYPVLIVGSITMLVPLYLLLSMSFKTTTQFYRNPYGLPSSLSFQNYLDAWFTGRMDVYVRNSIIISIGTVGITLVFSTLASYALARMRMRGKNIIFYVLLATLMVPTEIILLPIFIEFRDLHLLNTYACLIIPYASLGMAFSTYLLRGFFQTLPEELAEAARMDGAGEATTFWYVMLPLAVPGIATVAIFSFMSAWSEFFLASIFISNPDLRPITAGLLDFSSSYQTNWGATSAGYTIVIAPIVVVFLLLQRFFIRGLTFGALKG
jgi:ABC-type glycerol-3-phosphate transport system permease component